VEVVEVLAVDQEVEHVVPLPAHLRANLRIYEDTFGEWTTHA